MRSMPLASIVARSALPPPPVSTTILPRSVEIAGQRGVLTDAFPGEHVALARAQQDRRWRATAVGGDHRLAQGAVLWLAAVGRRVVGAGRAIGLGRCGRGRRQQCDRSQAARQQSAGPGPLRRLLQASHQFLGSSKHWNRLDGACQARSSYRPSVFPTGSTPVATLTTLSRPRGALGRSGSRRK